MKSAIRIIEYRSTDLWDGIEVVRRVRLDQFGKGVDEDDGWFEATERCAKVAMRLPSRTPPLEIEPGRARLMAGAHRLTRRLYRLKSILRGRAA